MQFLDRVTREGIPYRQYRWGQLLLAIVPGYLLHLLFTLLWTTLRETGHEKDRSLGNAIIVLYHPEFPITLSAQTTWRRHFRGVAYLGIHNWISYVTSVLCYLDALPAVRYDRATGKRPMDQVLEYLNTHPSVPFALRTDSGGPYRKVRTSIVRLALQTNRPVICLRQTASKAVVLHQHLFPLPFSTVNVSISEPISVETLQCLTLEEATALVQRTMDSIALK